MPLQLKPSDITALVVTYITSIPPGPFPSGGISSGELHVHLIPHGVTLTMHLAMIHGLAGAATKGKPLIRVTGHYLTLTPDGEKMREELLSILKEPKVNPFPSVRKVRISK